MSSTDPSDPSSRDLSPIDVDDTSPVDIISNDTSWSESSSRETPSSESSSIDIISDETSSSESSSSETSSSESSSSETPSSESSSIDIISDETSSSESSSREIISNESLSARRKRGVAIAIVERRNEEIKRQRKPGDYLPCEDKSRPVCRHFLRGKCSYGLKCRFYHPTVITPILEREATREFGFCYCGALQRTVINNRLYALGESSDVPTFFIVCGKTGKSMRHCV